MSAYTEITEIRTTVDSIPDGVKGIHESTLRAYHILEKVKNLLRLGTPAEVILDLIDIMEGQ